MISKFSKDHPWLYGKIKGYYWNFLSRYSNSYLYHSIDSDIKIRLLPSDDSVSKFIYFESYENETIALLKRIVLPGNVIYDIGANIGYYSIIFSKLVGPTGKVHSFEPSQREFLLLAENIQLNLLRNIYLNQLAVSDYSGILEMSIFEDPAYGAYNTVGEPTHPKVENRIFRKEPIRTISLDEYYSTYGVQIPSIIKIDVEGAELSVLKGGRELFSREESPILVLEICESTLKGAKVVPEQIVGLLKEYSYVLFSICLNGSLVPFSNGISLNIIALKGSSLLRFKQLGLITE